jgi:hypothetical protein
MVEHANAGLQIGVDPAHRLQAVGHSAQARRQRPEARRVSCLLTCWRRRNVSDHRDCSRGDGAVVVV